MARPGRAAVVSGLLAAAVTCAPDIGDAFWAQRSPFSRINMNLDLGTTQFQTEGYGRQSFNSLAERALNRWNEVGIGSAPDHAFFSATSPGRPAPRCAADGVNEVGFAVTDCDGFEFGDAVAITLIRSEKGRISQIDVMFNATIEWDAYPGPLRDEALDFYRVALHEFGHAFGLGHPDAIAQSVAAVMNSVISDVDDLRPDDIAGAHAIAWSPDGGMGPVLVSALLPASRSVRVGAAATAFAAVINTAPAAAENCRLVPETNVPAGFTFQTTDPETNQTTGTPSAPVTVPAGGSRTFVLAFTPTAPFSPVDASVVARCDNTDPSPRVSGVNTLLLSGSATAVPDLVALVATVSNDGIVTVPGAGNSAAFAVATVNVGAGDTITATADTAGAALPVSLTICPTDPGTGSCLAAAGPRAIVSIGAGVSSTFAVFVSTSGAVPFDPASNRIVVRFTDAAGVVRGATSVAVRTP